MYLRVDHLFGDCTTVGGSWLDDHMKYVHMVPYIVHDFHEKKRASFTRTLTLLHTVGTVPCFAFIVFLVSHLTF